MITSLVNICHLREMKEEEKEEKEKFSFPCDDSY